MKVVASISASLICIYSEAYVCAIKLGSLNLMSLIEFFCLEKEKF